MACGMSRGDVRLYQFASPDKHRPVVVLTRDSAVPYLSTVTVAPITTTIRGVPSEVRLTENDGIKALCRKSAQCRDRHPESPGKAGSTARFPKNGGNLCSVALQPRLRLAWLACPPQFAASLRFRNDNGFGVPGAPRSRVIRVAILEECVPIGWQLISSRFSFAVDHRKLYRSDRLGGTRGAFVHALILAICLAVAIPLCFENCGEDTEASTSLALGRSPKSIQNWRRNFKARKATRSSNSAQLLGMSARALASNSGTCNQEC
jgi:mRNA interferase MazF